MATEEKTDIPSAYSLIVIGGGSGGLGAARRAAQYLGPNKVAIFEEQHVNDGGVRLGGTCVNVGCVPKKVMWNTATMSSWFREYSAQYGFEFDNLRFNFDTIKRNRDAYIARLDGIYERNVDRAGIVCVNEHVRFIDRHTIEAGGKQYTADTILIATGGYPYIPKFLSAEDRDLVMTSDDFFYKLEALPAKTAVVGAGYIAVELGQVMQALGSQVSLFIRHDFALRGFDVLIQKGVREAVEHSGVNLVRNTTITAIERAEDGRKTLIAGDVRYEGFDCVIYAIGRGPNESELNLGGIGVKQDGRGFVPTDKYERCFDAQSGEAIDGLYALGDINNKIALTPVAIRAGRAFSDRLYGGPQFAETICEYDYVPSVVFTHPPVGSCGLTEREVKRRIALEDGDADKLPAPLHRYESHFNNLFYGVYEMDDHHRVKTHMKVICVGQEERVVGLHMIGEGCDEMLQGFGVAMRMGATKADFDNCVAIHPTGAEELVTLGRNPRDEDYQYTYEFEKSNL